MSHWQLWLLVAGAALMVVGAVHRRLGRQSHGYKGYSFSRKDLLTANEWEFFNRLLAAVPELHVFPQVSMGALMHGKADNGKHHMARNVFSRKIVDFVIVNKKGRTLMLVELDDRMHDKKRDRARDDITRSAGYVTLRFESRDKPSVAQLRRAIMQHI